MKNKTLLFSITLILIAGTALALTQFKAHQKLGKPGIMAKPIPHEVKMQIALPAAPDGFTSTNVPESEVELGYFPKDTSYTRRCYQADDGGFPIYATIVMMGADRTSIHKPDYCLPGQGWQIQSRTIIKIPVAGAHYELPVSKWIVSNTFTQPDGSRQTVNGLYVFWFVADGEETPSHYQRLWWLTRDMLKTGILQRWAYISYFAPCEPGTEEATFERVKKLISNSVAQFQYPPANAQMAETVKN
ncbi:MAG TPA: exosortase-associated EpsI family protein [Verrucomicrobiae bacterium]|nr:exosortase-associated EpsI family protein [Verrucomicrobiae bacterium]